MALKEKIAETSGIPKSRIPGSFQVIGGISLLKFPRNARVSAKEKLKISEALMKILPNVRTVCEVSGIVGELRKPKIRFLSGDRSFRTIHKEHGIFYAIDVSKAMFSKGNLFERQRLICQIKPGESIIDMFAGIGYFSLGLARFSKAGRVISIEKNPVSFRYLKKNIELNHINNIIPIKGDCRSISKQRAYVGIADRIIMGYLPRTYKFLPHAFRFAKPGCIIHYHDTFLASELWKKPQKILETAARKAGYKIKILKKKKVKSFAPNVWHIVIDFEAK